MMKHQFETDFKSFSLFYKFAQKKGKLKQAFHFIKFYSVDTCVYINNFVV